MAGDRKQVLVIDDHEDEREIQRAMLTHLGYEVRAAGDGAAGIEAACSEIPDLILLDVAMPGMDGFSVCRALRADTRTADVPILLYTASVVGDLEDLARAAGVTAVLTKPLDPRSVAAAIGEHISERRA
jgi:two-component system cell cycle response regulator DivK